MNIINHKPSAYGTNGYVTHRVGPFVYGTSGYIDHGAGLSTRAQTLSYRATKSPTEKVGEDPVQSTIDEHNNYFSQTHE